MGSRDKMVSRHVARNFAFYRSQPGPAQSWINPSLCGGGDVWDLFNAFTAMHQKKKYQLMVFLSLRYPLGRFAVESREKETKRHREIYLKVVFIYVFLDLQYYNKTPGFCLFEIWKQGTRPVTQNIPLVVRTIFVIDSTDHLV